MAEKINMIDSAKDYKVYFSFPAPLNGGEDVDVLLGNLNGYVFKGQRAGSPKWGMGMGRDPIAFNRGIEKLEGQCSFNTLSVDFESDFAYLLNTLKSLSNNSNLKAGAKNFVNTVFSEIHRRRGNTVNTIASIMDIKDLTPDEVTLDLIPEFNIVAKSDTKKEVVEGVQFFAKDTSIGVSTIGTSTSYQFSARNVRPLDDLE